MKNKSGYFKTILFTAIGLLLVAGMVMKLGSNKTKAREQVFQFDSTQSVLVGTETIKMEMVRDTQSFTGTFEPFRETKVSADVQGKIRQVLVDAGSRVRQGQPLVRLDHSLLDLQLAGIDVQIEGLEADIKRYSTLVAAEAIQGVQLEKAQLGLKAAKVQRSTVEEQIRKTTISAPFAGVVTMKFAEAGGFAAPGIPLVQLTDVNSLKFTVNVPEGSLRLFDTQREYRIRADIYPEKMFSAKVRMIGTKANPGNSYPVEFLIKNMPDALLKSGMFGKVLLDESVDQSGILIPYSAIVGSAGQPQVYLIRNGKAQLKDIRYSKVIANRALVSDGLVPDDQLITRGLINLKNGIPVHTR